mmetsp:Transcript_116024/g.323153  ORF Transcript_116024/g.323153 Transcript_116024/m.323153 type:complete len:451 (-) Transcript_116024:104-1456(-)
MAAHAASIARHASHVARGSTGTLWVVGGPIGNLGDISTRAAALLQGVSVIASESVHTAEALLRSLRQGAAVPALSGSDAAPCVVSYHAHNEPERAPELLTALQDGKDVALLARAGTPLLRDPGCVLVSAAHAKSLPVRTLPGPSSLTAALSVSGLQGDRLFFDGYLPALRSARTRRLQQLRSRLCADGLHVTLAAFCEAASLHEVLTDATESLGSHTQACVAKDLTMPHERVIRAPLHELRDKWAALPLESRRGAVVLLVELLSSEPMERRQASLPPSSPPLVLEASSSSLHDCKIPPEEELSKVAKILVRGGVRPQQAALLAAQLTGVAMSTAQSAVQHVALSQMDFNPADALPAGAQGGGCARHTLHLVNLGPGLTSEELEVALAGLGTPSGDLSVTDNHLGERVAFVRFATPEAAAAARARINMASVMLGSSRPVLAGWARRERWLS